jgi:hypothetical protein
VEGGEGGRVLRGGWEGFEKNCANQARECDYLV